MTQVFDGAVDTDATEVYHEAAKEDEVKEKEDEAFRSEDEEFDGEYPEQHQQVIAQVALSLEWLTDLHATVERHGVSTHDMRALREIRDMLGEHHIAFSPVPSLEHYPLGSYSDERSSINLEPALESIARTIVTTIKSWIRKLIEYIKRLVAWFKRTFRKEEYFEKQFDAMHAVISVIRQGRADVDKRRTTRPSKDLEKKVFEERQEFLQDGDLKRSPLQLAALGDNKQLAAVGELSKNTETLARNTETFVDMVEEVLANNPDHASQVDTTSLTLGGMLTDDAKVLQSEMPQRQYLKQHVKLEVFDDLTVLKTMTEVTPYDYLEALYVELVKQLTNIREISDNLSHENFNHVPKLLKDVSTNVDQLSLMATFFYRFNVIKYNTLLKLSRHDITVFNLVYSDAVSNAPDIRARESLQKIRDHVNTTAKKEKMK